MQKYKLKGDGNVERKIAITSETLKKFIYFAVSKFEFDSLHHQGTSTKSDYIGGFIDRWINKLTEDVLFNQLLLANKEYTAGIDYFLYDNRSEKNAPDILGLEKGSKVIPFAKYNEGSWNKVDNMPWIEIKTFRINQKLLSVRDSQMNDNHYYVIAELSINPNYLKGILSKDIFKPEVKNGMKMLNDYIESDSQGLIKQIDEVQNEIDIIGEVRLLGIFKGSDLRRNCNLLEVKQSVKYVSNIEKVNSIPRPNINEQMEVDSELLYKVENQLHIKVHNSNNIIIKKKNKGSMYIEVNNYCVVNGQELEHGFFRIDFASFDRSSNWTEFIAHKYTFDERNDNTVKLIEILDEIARSFFITISANNRDKK